jgi:hypothetical protein
MKRLEVIFLRLLLFVLVILVAIATLMFFGIFFWGMLLFGFISWLCTGDIYAWVPEWFDIAKLWSKVNNLQKTIDKKQIVL